MVSQVQVAKVGDRVSEAHALFVFIFSVATIVACCASTTICVRAARDSNIAMNALNIRRKYQRNMQLYMIVKEKQMIDKQLAKAANGLQSSSMTDSRSMTEDDQDSSFITSSADNSASY